MLSLHELTGATMSIVGHDQPEDISAAIRLEPDRARSLKVYVRQPKELAGGRTQRLRFHVQDLSSLDDNDYVTSFEAPE